MLKNFLLVRLILICYLAYLGHGRNLQLRRELRSSTHYIILYIHFENYINAGSQTMEKKACDNWILDENCDYDFHVCIGDELDPCSYADRKFGTFSDAMPILYFHHELDVTLKLFRVKRKFTVRIRVTDKDFYGYDVVDNLHGTIDLMNKNRGLIRLSGSHSALYYRFHLFCGNMWTGELCNQRVKKAGMEPIARETTKNVTLEIVPLNFTISGNKNQIPGFSNNFPEYMELASKFCLLDTDNGRRFECKKFTIVLKNHSSNFEFKELAECSECNSTAFNFTLPPIYSCDEGVINPEVNCKKIGIEFIVTGTDYIDAIWTTINTSTLNQPHQVTLKGSRIGNPATLTLVMSLS
ncbi:hypothetical protein TrispH2_007137 [Trichoplax sp. H2]|nr:hypothetical protein TrispH2_007137 [Trichoplax sp. H2]|eukprot:RDD40184.1 hypothetical protein TrispH2_007137 [Trichoplax sp. H2]